MVRSAAAHPEAPLAPAPQRPAAGWLRRSLPAILVALYLAQCLWFVRTQSLTYDEPVHIAEGLDAWRHGRFEQYNDHPPLVRLLCALPLIGQKWQLEIQPLAEGFHIASIAPDPQSLAWRARFMNVLLGLLLAWLLWHVASHMFSREAATVSLVLFAFSPSLIAHFSLATTDGAAALLIFAAAWQLVGWRREPAGRQSIWAGVILGLMLLAKFSTAVMFLLALLWMLVLKPDRVMTRPSRWNWGRTGAALLLAAVVVWAGYFFHVSHLSVRSGKLTATFPNWSEQIEKPVQTGLNFSLPVPAGEYIEGFRALVRHNRHGQAAFFLGQVSQSGGWKLYYPTAMLLKWPAVVLALCFAGLALGAVRKLSFPTDLGIMMSFPALYFCLAVFSHFNIGERHILPLYPFALLLAGAVWEHASQRRATVVLLVLLLGLNAADALRFAPGYLSYFNVAVNPAESYRLMTDSNLDWGQGLLALRQYERNHPREQIWLAYFGSVDPRVYGITARPLPENVRVTGTVVVSATNLSGQFLQDPQSYRWLLQYPRTEILDHSLYVFKVQGSPTPPLRAP
ncbi:MAG: glycosyltransferase family 39 protein [Acidobacteriia bacterium]|nr:glycosyltransferase family 39 protein [Terriglobia bacterium]